MLKKLVPLVICMLLVGLSPLVARAADDIGSHRECTQCGMDRKAYDYSRMLIVYEDGSQVGVCSLHCVASELHAHKDKKVKSLMVADFDSRVLIAADKAVWVMGGSKRGVMTKQPKWAFATKAAAQAFTAANGGKIVSWDEALAAAKGETMPMHHH